MNLSDSGASPPPTARDDALVSLGDTELVALVRSGDLDAFGVLFERHREVATRAARRMVDHPTADDAVAEVFVKLLRMYLVDRGPSDDFQRYLLRAVRNAAIDSRRRRRDTPAEITDRDIGPAFHDAVFGDPAERIATNDVARQALMRLPPRWRQVLWLSEVEGYDRHEIGRVLALRPGAVSALAMRAREGLRQAYLGAHAAAARSVECREVGELMPAYVRGRSSRRATQIVLGHVEDCEECARALRDLHGMNTSLGAFLVPALLGALGIDSSGAGGHLVGTAPSGRLGRVGLAVTAAFTAAVTAAVTVATVVGASLIGTDAGAGGAAPGHSATAALPTPHADPLAPRDIRPGSEEHSDNGSIGSAVPPPDEPTRVPGPTVPGLDPAAPVAVPPVTPRPIATTAPTGPPFGAAGLNDSQRIGPMTWWATRESAMPVHVSVPVDIGDFAPTLVLNLDVRVPAYRVHLGNPGFGDWTCLRSSGTEDERTTELVCRLSDAAGTRRSTLGIDLDYHGLPTITAQVVEPAHSVPAQTGSRASLTLPQFP